MNTFDINNVPEILPDDILAYFAKLYIEPNKTEWNSFRGKLSSDHGWQVFREVERIREKEKQDMLAEMSAVERQEYDDKWVRSANSFYARDSGELSIFDEYNMVLGSSSVLANNINRQSEYGERLYQKLLKWKKRMNVYEEFYFFESKDHFLSSYYPVTFTIDEIQYNSLLHYVMYQKSYLFRDRESMAIILKSSDQDQIFELGRNVKYFNPKVWRLHIGGILEKGITQKFEQNKELNDLFLSTRGKTIAMADVNDKKWGTGISTQSPLAKYRSSWKGLNLFGEIHTLIRTQFENV